MDSDTHFPFSEEDTSENDEIGSDELLADENLRLPEGANILVRLHAVRAWLSHRLNEASIEVGEAALAFQEQMRDQAGETRVRRRAHEIEAVQEQFQYAQKMLVD